MLLFVNLCLKGGASTVHPLPTGLQIVHFPFSTPGADVTRLRMLDLDAGKGRQVMKYVHAATARSGATTLQSLKSMRDMCSREL